MKFTGVARGEQKCNPNTANTHRACKLIRTQEGLRRTNILPLPIAKIRGRESFLHSTATKEQRLKDGRMGKRKVGALEKVDADLYGLFLLPRGPQLM